MPNLTGLLTHTQKSYYKVINLSSWTPQLCFIKNDVIVHYFLVYFLNPLMAYRQVDLAIQIKNNPYGHQ